MLVLRAMPFCAIGLALRSQVASRARAAAGWTRGISTALRAAERDAAQRSSRSVGPLRIAIPNRSIRPTLRRPRRARLCTCRYSRGRRRDLRRRSRCSRPRPDSLPLCRRRCSSANLRDKCTQTRNTPSRRSFFRSPRIQIASSPSSRCRHCPSIRRYPRRRRSSKLSTRRHPFPRTPNSNHPTHNQRWPRAQPR